MEIGDRVATIRDIDLGDYVILPQGSIGVIKEIEGDRALVGDWFNWGYYGGNDDDHWIALKDLEYLSSSQEEMEDLNKLIEELRGKVGKLEEENKELKEGLRDMARYILQARAPNWRNPFGVPLAQLVEERVNEEIEEITGIVL